MRKLIVANISSVDGYYEGPGRNVMALPMDHSFDAYNAERLRSAGTLLLGRNTYEQLKGYWPERADDPDASEDEREISRRNAAIAKVVVSDSLTEEQTDPWRETTRIVRRADANEAIGELRQGSGEDILVFGSRTLWNELLAAGLIDEIHLMVGGIVLGGGTPAFGGTEAKLHLLGTRRFSGSENLLIRYAPEPM